MWREHESIVIGAVNPYELGVKFALTAINCPDLFLKFNIRFMYILLSFKVFPVRTYTVRSQLRFNEINRSPANQSHHIRY